MVSCPHRILPKSIDQFFELVRGFSKAVDKNMYIHGKAPSVLIRKRCHYNVNENVRILETNQTKIIQDLMGKIIKLLKGINNYLNK